MIEYDEPGYANYLSERILPRHLTLYPFFLNREKGMFRSYRFDTEFFKKSVICGIYGG